MSTSRNLLKTDTDKAANIGGDQETGFENSFSSLAFTYLQDKAPRLLDYLVGFQLVDRNDDNTKAMGVFGFQVSNKWIYAPVFFMNGDMKGHELLYLKDTDMFVPMKENWVNYLLSKKTFQLGEGTGRTPRQLGIYQPDLMQMSHPPLGGKVASAGPALKKFAQGFAPVMAACATRNPYNLKKFANLNDRLDLVKALKTDIDLVKAAKDTFDKYPEIKRSFEQIYGADALRNVLLGMRKEAEEAPGLDIFAAPKVEHTKVSADILGRVQEKVKTAEEAGRLKLAVKEDVFKGKSLFSDPEKKKLMSDGYLVRDNRSNDEISHAYNTQIKVSLQNPSESGLYEILIKEGEFKRCLILFHPHGNSGRHEFCTIIDPDSKQWVNADPNVIWIRHQETREEYLKYVDSLDDADSLSEGSTYVAICPGGSGSVPFEIKEDRQNDYYDVWFRDYVDSRYEMPRSRPRWGCEPHPYCSENVVQLNGRKGSRLNSKNGTLYVPSGAKVITVKESKRYDSVQSVGPDDNKGVNDQSAEPPLRPGNIVDLQAFIMQKTAELKVHTDHHEYYIGSARKPFSKLAALFHLVRDHGLREKVAKIILKDAERFGGTRVRVKYATPYASGDGPGMPGFPEPSYGSDPTYGNVPTQQPMEQNVPISELSAHNTDPSVYNPHPDYTPDPSTMQMAQNAAQTGQKDVFDTAMLSSMLKAVRKDSLVDRYLGDLMKALDRLGRVLFMFYWHNEEFTDRYGKQDMPEMEDTLRNAFEIMGDLILFLKSKSVEPGAMQRLNDPDIEEAARN